MTENTPRDPADRPDPEPRTPGAGEPEPRLPPARPTEPQRPAATPSQAGRASRAEPPAGTPSAGTPGTPSPADTPAGVTPPGAPPPGGYGASSHGRHGAPPPGASGAQPPAGSGAEPPGGPGGQPPGGYGAPPPGGNAGQPPGGPGAPPPGGSGTPPPYGGGGPAGGEAGGGPGVPSGTFRVGEALGYAWRKFTGNALLWILFALLLLVVGGLPNVFSGSVTQDMWGSGGPSVNADFDAGASLLGLVGAVLAGIVQGLGTNAALRETSGLKPTVASLFRAPHLGMIVVAALLLIAAYSVGALLCGIGLLVAAVFAVFTYQGVIDKDQNAWEAFIASFKLVGRNFGSVFLLELALLGINILGAIPCGLGWLITIPLSYLALAFAYRRLTGGPVMA